MSRTLVVYYSRTGTTARVAAQLAALLDADIDVITERRSRRGLRGFLRSGLEASTQRAPVLGAPLRNPSDYDMVVVGSPTWAASVCSPVRAYLKAYGPRVGAAAFFSTCGGRGGERALAQMEKLWRKKPAATLALVQAQVDVGDCEDALRSFADQVASAAAPRVSGIPRAA